MLEQRKFQLLPITKRHSGCTQIIACVGPKKPQDGLKWQEVQDPNWDITKTLDQLYPDGGEARGGGKPRTLGRG